MTHPPIIVEQGPRWLAELLVGPPGWLYPAVVFGLLGVALFLAWGIARVGLTPAVAREMLGNGLTAGLIGATTWVLVEFGAFAYAVDVAGGVVAGYLLAQLAFAGVLRVPRLGTWLQGQNCRWNQGPRDRR